MVKDAQLAAYDPAIYGMAHPRLEGPLCHGREGILFLADAVYSTRFQDAGEELNDPLEDRPLAKGTEKMNLLLKLRLQADARERKRAEAKRDIVACRMQMGRSMEEYGQLVLGKRS